MFNKISKLIQKNSHCLNFKKFRHITVFSKTINIQSKLHPQEIPQNFKPSTTEKKKPKKSISPKPSIIFLLKMFVLHSNARHGNIFLSGQKRADAWEPHIFKAPIKKNDIESIFSIPHTFQSGFNGTFPLLSARVKTWPEWTSFLFSRRRISQQWKLNHSLRQSTAVKDFTTTSLAHFHFNKQAEFTTNRSFPVVNCGHRVPRF